MIYFTYLIAIGINSLILVKTIRNNIKGKYKILDFAIYIFFIFFVSPLILDLIFGLPIYDSYPGFYDASRDKSTIMIYNLLIVVPPLIWVFFKNNAYVSMSNINFNVFIVKNPLIIYILIVLLTLPVLLLLMSPNPEAYLIYGPRGERLSSAGVDYHFYLRTAVMISLFICFYILYVSKNFYITLFFLSPILATDIWLHGKRSIVFTILIILLILFIIKIQIKGTKLVLLVGTTAFLLVFFSLFYQFELRDIEDRPIEKQYENIRVDFGRDDEMKLAIYREAETQPSILEYRGQSFLFYLTFFIPREIWPEKPYPYAQYLTSSIFNSPPQLWGWGMTTSIFGEFLANFGYIGIIIAAFFILVLANTADKSNNFWFKIFTLIIIMNFMTVHLSAFLVNFILYLIFAIFILWKERISHESNLRT